MLELPLVPRRSSLRCVPAARLHACVAILLLTSTIGCRSSQTRVEIHNRSAWTLAVERVDLQRGVGVIKRSEAEDIEPGRSVIEEEQMPIGRLRQFFVSAIDGVGGPLILTAGRGDRVSIDVVQRDGRLAHRRARMSKAAPSSGRGPIKVESRAEPAIEDVAARTDAEGPKGEGP